MSRRIFLLLLRLEYDSISAHVGPLATILRELRQARKGATVAKNSCAGVWLTWPIYIMFGSSEQTPAFHAGPA